MSLRSEGSELRKEMKEVKKEAEKGVLCRDKARDVFGEYRLMREDGGDPRAFLRSLGDRDRGIFLAYLCEEGFAPVHISAEFGVSVVDVRDAWSRGCLLLGRRLVEVGVEEVLGNLQMRKDKVVQMAIEGGRPDVVWRTEREYVDVLQSLGVIEKAVEKKEVKHSVDEGTQREIERMLSLRQREEENRKLQAEARDAEVVEPDTRSVEEPDTRSVEGQEGVEDPDTRSVEGP